MRWSLRHYNLSQNSVWNVTNASTCDGCHHCHRKHYCHHQHQYLRQDNYYRWPCKLGEIAEVCFCEFQEDLDLFLRASRWLWSGSTSLKMTLVCFCESQDKLCLFLRVSRGPWSVSTCLKMTLVCFYVFQNDLGLFLRASRWIWSDSTILKMTLVCFYESQNDLGLFVVVSSPVAQIWPCISLGRSIKFVDFRTFSRLIMPTNTFGPEICRGEQIFCVNNIVQNMKGYSIFSASHKGIWVCIGIGILIRNLSVMELGV